MLKMKEEERKATLEAIDAMIDDRSRGYEWVHMKEIEDFSVPLTQRRIRSLQPFVCGPSSMLYSIGVRQLYVEYQEQLQINSGLDSQLSQLQKSKEEEAERYGVLMKQYEGDREEHSERKEALKVAHDQVRMAVI